MFGLLASPDCEKLCNSESLSLGNNGVVVLPSSEWHVADVAVCCCLPVGHWHH
jgi:hypothetical protein